MGCFRFYRFLHVSQVKSIFNFFGDLEPENTDHSSHVTCWEACSSSIKDWGYGFHFHTSSSFESHFSKFLSNLVFLKFLKVFIKKKIFMHSRHDSKALSSFSLNSHLSQALSIQASKTNNGRFLFQLSLDRCRF